ncbi:MAG: segregation/condensation protein A [Ilumatobacter coccineus]|uniref:Segregation and condensation protein A n=1 Tax=Ilumatobacter coccineus TaxID=467094 RepID=A0A2G6K9S3_9ACTN|nr:MAG: segregation/condensation protein A [Ilumatobacter coccineus]
MSIDVSTPVFDGPFDLLLHLIVKDEVDLYEIDLAHIVDAYLAEVERMQALDLNIATEFLLIAATLVELKTRRLLPGADDGDLDDEFALWEERDLLLARLIECKTFKDVASVFGALADEADLSFARAVGPDERFANLQPDLLAGTSLRRFHSAAIRAFSPKPVPTVDLLHIHAVKASVADAVVELVDELPRLGRATFRRLTDGLTERLDIIVRFLAILELFKEGYIEIDQDSRLGDIDIRWTATEPVELSDLLVDAYDG